ncbi:MAG: hypothetical protein MJZ45_03165 [Bacteroidales bacterium]|nr:hypothetical protein [Bacteroidales bacterium]
MEDNKAFFRLMAVIAAVITVMGMAVLVLTGENLTQKLTTPLILLFCNGILGLGLYAGIEHPEWNVRYGLTRQDGRLRMRRILRASDPEGLRWRGYGLVMPIFALLMAVILISGHDSRDLPLWATIIVSVLAVAMGCILVIIEYRLKDGNTYKD